MPVDWLVDGRVATLTVTGEGEQRDVVTPRVLQAIDLALKTYDADSAVRAAILRSDSGAFDMKAPTGSVGIGAGPSVVTVHRPAKPVIAALSGVCQGEGLVLVGQVSDVRIAARGCRFGFGDGAGAAAAIRSRLSRKIPYTSLMWLVATGQTIGAAEALRVGLVDEVVSESDVLASAREEAEAVAQMPPLSTRSEMRALIDSEDAPYGDEIFYGGVLWAIGRLSSDAAEGLSAFNERRTPRFRNG